MSVAVRSSSAAALAAAALLSGGGVAQASLVSSNGQVHGCVAKTGLLRVVRATSKCKRGEQSITFVARGTGPRGPAGPAGAPGTPGTPADTTAVATLETKVSTLEGDVSALQATLAGVTRSGNTLRLSGLNLRLDSGAGSTDAPVNGLGNLFIGDNGSPGVQTGSNNLVIGDGQTFTSYGGLVAGTKNTIQAPSASVTGGTNNVASGSSSAVGGGELNSAAGQASFIGGGCDNVAGSGPLIGVGCSFTDDQAVLGGIANMAPGDASGAVGGTENTVTGAFGAAIGGEFNIAADTDSAIVAGCDNITGAGTAHTSTCDPGGEGDMGGARITNTTKDGTSGAISDGVNYAGTGTIGLTNLLAGDCDQFPVSLGGLQVGDVVSLAYAATAPPAGLVIVPIGVHTAGQVLVNACNESTSSITWSSVVRLLALR
jgi:hypothetical protein